MPYTKVLLNITGGSCTVNLCTFDLYRLTTHHYTGFSQPASFTLSLVSCAIMRVRACTLCACARALCMCALWVGVHARAICHVCFVGGCACACDLSCVLCGWVCMRVCFASACAYVPCGYNLCVCVHARAICAYMLKIISGHR